MPTYQENLIIARDNLAAAIANHTGGPGALISSNGLDGETYTYSLTQALAALKEIKNEINVASGPFILRTKQVQR